MVINAETTPQVAIDFMNDTHGEEVVMVRKLGEAIVAYQQGDNKNVAQISELLVEWQEHTQAHFERENRLMKQVNFPAYPIHSSEHEAALSTMADVVGLWQKKQDVGGLAEYVFVLWPAWFSTHVETMDTMTAQFAVMAGFDPRSSTLIETSSK